MPVAHSGSILFSIATVEMALDNGVPMRMRVVFSRTIGGKPDGQVECYMEQSDLVAFLQGHAPALSSRSDDLTDYVYAWAINHQHITGSVQ